MIGPVSNFVSGRQQIERRQWAVGEEGIEQLQATIDEFAKQWGAANEGKIVQTDRLVGFCLLIRREVIDRIGLFDERFAIGNFEDDDYCRRGRAAGFGLAIATDSFVHHFGGATFIGSGIDHWALMRRNERLFREKWRMVSSQPSVVSDQLSDSGSQPSTLDSQRSTLLSLCMIARDNEQTIAAALEVIRKYVDDIVVVDTGSKDRTPEIAASLGARVFHCDWCDYFSAARNESIRHALGEWIFWMDTDDVIDDENGQRLRELVRGQSSVASSGASLNTEPSTLNMPVLGFLMKVRCPTTSGDGEAGYIEVDQVKLLRNLPGAAVRGADS